MYHKSLAEYINRVTQGDAIHLLDQLPSDTLHTVVTSPPYWALRDYGLAVISHFPAIEFTIYGMPVKVSKWTGQLGLEPDPMLFVAHMVYIFRKVKRVLRPDGTLWMNFGDSYAAASKDRTEDMITRSSSLKYSGNNQAAAKQPLKSAKYLKPKDLCGMPWMVAMALRDDGWYLRQDIIWSKPNPMPESVNDRCTKSHEYIFLLSKTPRYYYNQEAIKTKEASLPSKWKTADGWDTSKGSHGSYHKNGREKGKKRYASTADSGLNGKWDKMTKQEQVSQGANKRSVWEVATRPFTDAHFATYPQQLIVDCIRAGCPDHVCADCGSPYMPIYNRELVPTIKAGKRVIVDDRDYTADKQDQGSNRAKDGHKPAHVYQSQISHYTKTCDCQWSRPDRGIVLDPFGGSNTTGIVASKQQRHWISFEINPDYEPIYTKRTILEANGGLFT